MNAGQRTVEELIQATYDTGYYCGQGQSGTEPHKLAVRKRNAIKAELLAILEVKDTTIEVLTESVAELQGEVKALERQAFP